LGQLLVYRLENTFSWTTALLLALYGLLMQLYIAFWNDWVDQEADRLNQNPTPFSGGSRVLPEGLLPPRALFATGALAALFILGLGLLFTRYLDRPWTLLLFASGTFLLWAYSIPPLRLNYRGGGELLQTLGCGLLLPTIGYYAQANSFPDSTFLLPYCLHQLAIAIAFTLPDCDADQQAGKRTLSTLITPKHAGKLAVFFAILAQFCLLIARPHGFILSPLNLPSLPLLAAFLLLPWLNTSRKNTVRFVALTLATGSLYVLGIFLSNKV
jgi:1,4-dihydroxy-2-naphthoate octaprenyltransferase